MTQNECDEMVLCKPKTPVKKHSKEDLRKIFETICDVNDWRKGVNKSIPLPSQDEMAMIEDAVMYFIGNEVEWTPINSKRIRIKYARPWNFVT